MQKEYNQNFGDLVPIIVSNAFKVELCIFNESDNNHIQEIAVAPWSTASDSLVVHRHNDHYNGVKLLQQYSSEFLRSLQPRASQISRKTRKSLFKYKIWKPRSYDKTMEERSQSQTNRCSTDEFSAPIPVIWSNHRSNTPPESKHHCRYSIQVPVKPAPGNSQSRLIDMVLINCRSVNKNGHKLKDYVVEKDCDLAAITETWLPMDMDKADTIVKGACPKTYKMPHIPRQTGKNGGGVGLLHKRVLSIKPLNTVHFDSFEYTELLLKHNSNTIRIIVVYRPPPSDENMLTERQFLDEFEKFLERQIVLPGEILLVGDFNFHVDDILDYYANQFSALIKNFGLIQHIHKPTHNKGHTLDLVITKQDSMLVGDISVTLPWVSDHSIIHFKLRVRKPSYERKTISFRQWKSVDRDSLEQDIVNANLLSCDTTEDLVSQYTSTMKELADKHAPVKIKTITVRPQAEWFTTELEEEKRKKRKLERCYKVTLSSKEAEAFDQHCAYYSNLLQETRQKFYTAKIEANVGNHKALYNVLNKLLHRDKEQQLPSHKCLYELTNRFADFFTEKIQMIHCKINSMITATSSFFEEEQKYQSEMSEYAMVSEFEMEKIIRKSSTKSCSLDPIPTWLLKECINPLLPIITKIVNLSLSEGVMPVDFKEANLLPLLKGPSMDVEILKHFRPVSNLVYVSKLVEKVVDSQITTHMTFNNLHDPLQSSYKKYHSTETAMVRLHSDILTALDENKAVLVICIDLSAAFDTVDHQCLLNRMEKRLGITGTCLKWFKSYLSNRKQKVVINGVSSTARALTCGVPQGSVLGPKCYNMYTLPVGDIISKHEVDHQLYADDGQLYIAFKAKDAGVTNERMQVLAHDLKDWYVANSLMANDDKLIAMLINGPLRKPILLPPLTMGEVEVPLSLSAKILGVHVDNTISMVSQVNSVTKACFYQLHKIYKVRQCVTEEAAKTMVHTLVTSRLDYCNALYYGLPDVLLNKLWCVQKSAARLITMSRKYDHISPVMEQLHWLPIWERIEYKILLLTYKSLHDQAPIYLSDLLKLRTNWGSRRDHLQLLIDPKINRKTFGGRAFKKSAPVLWNKTPSVVRDSRNVTIFKKNLKTHLCRRVYHCKC